MAESGSDPLRIAIVGAESTGKTTLAAALAAALQRRVDLRVAWVPERLREWCAEQGRTPLVSEQAQILEEQHARIEAAAAAHAVVVCDTTALMTAVYSHLIFGDRSLQARALHLHRGMQLTLLTAIDLPWIADGHQRDGPQVREPVDTALRELLLAHRLPFAVIGGQGPARLAQALGAVAPLLRGGVGSARRARLTGFGTEPRAQRPRWSCECCVPEAEQALLRR